VIKNSFSPKIVSRWTGHHMCLRIKWFIKHMSVSQSDTLKSSTLQRSEIKGAVELTWLIRLRVFTHFFPIFEDWGIAMKNVNLSCECWNWNLTMLSHICKVWFGILLKHLSSLQTTAIKWEKIAFICYSRLKFVNVHSKL
jgi:hypothetical protein